MENNFQQPQVINPQTPKQPVFSKAAQSIPKKTVIIAIIILLVLSTGSASYLLLSGQKKNANSIVSKPVPTTSNISPTISGSRLSPSLEPTKVASPTLTIDPTANWNIYNNPKYNYSIKYPKNWTAKNQGQIEPKIPDYVVFNPATESGRTVTISYSTRNYQESATIGALQSDPIKIGTVSGVTKIEKDSNGNTSIHTVLPIKINNSLVFYAENAFKDIFNKMLTTLKFL